MKCPISFGDLFGEWTHVTLEGSAERPFHPSFSLASVRPSLLALLNELGFSTPSVEAVKEFEPQGASLVFGGADFRLIVHTWPEHNVATFDFHGMKVEALPELHLIVKRVLGWHVPSAQIHWRQARRSKNAGNHAARDVNGHASPAFVSAESSD